MAGGNSAKEEAAPGHRNPSTGSHAARASRPFSSPTPRRCLGASQAPGGGQTGLQGGGP